MNGMQRILRTIDSVNEWVGKVVSFLIYPLIGVTIYEIAMRYFLSKSQVWVPEVSTFIFGALFVLGGGYVLLHEGHVKLDIIYNFFPTKTKASIDIVTSIFFFLFYGILIWKGSLMAWDSLITLETSASAFAPPLFPSKMMIPIGASLLLLAGLSKLIRDVFIATGKHKV
jgi:TRAP-type mannitol/chloroaromatic compound transport system permease small subunit